jgi:16S rRNA (uracil1498-N3)-methyltransferase
MVEKVTELGASEIIPIISQHSQYQNINFKKLEQKIVQTCEQCQRIDIPSLQKAIKIEDFLQKYCRDYKIFVGDERPSETNLDDIIEKKSIFLVGPEGGFSTTEYNFLDRYEKLQKFHLGPNILRSETAAIAFVSVWICKFSRNLIL